MSRAVKVVVMRAGSVFGVVNVVKLLFFRMFRRKTIVERLRVAGL